MKRLAGLAMAVVLTACSSIPNYRALAQKVVPTTVELVAEETNTLSEQKSPQAYCTGTAISPTHILTAGHCINLPENSVEKTYKFGEKNDLIQIRTPDGKLYFAHVVVSILTEEGKDGMDAALLILDNPVLTAIAEIGDSDTVQTGDVIAIVGNSYGHLTYSFATGVVAFVGRILPHGTYIQATVESRGGNSGGPAFDKDGRIVGIVTRSDRAGITFIVPINAAIVALAKELK